MGTTPLQAFRYPDTGDNNDVPTDMLELATDAERRSVMIFANAAARTAAFAAAAITPTPGMISYLTDVARHDRYHGSTWKPLGPRFAKVTVDQNVGPSNTTLQNVTELVMPLDPSTTYDFVLALQYASNSTADLKLGFTVPVGTTMDYIIVGFNTAEAISLNRGTEATVMTQGGSVNSLLLYGTVTTGATAGNLQVQAAQNTSTAVATNIEAGSYMRALQVA